ncbi:ribonuclease-like 3 [Betta splendens]|uniref:Ribonuclease-like 3 n=1 Tax=Betta splendens TaxID=158456 RepID=A0A6P7NW48_BETSP|nr:ribonuclease-like 3 [Betta splendens]
MKVQLVFLLLVLLSAAVFSQTVEDRYQHFLSQHVNDDMSVKRCDVEMSSRSITGANNACKETNTFILAGKKLVRGVCGQAGEPYQQGRNLRISLQPFSVIVCELKNQVRPPRCEYRGRARTVRIVIGCEKDFPVHYQESALP